MKPELEITASNGTQGKSVGASPGQGLLGAAARTRRRKSDTRELEMETFSGRRRPDWQRKPGTKAAVASRQK